MGFVLIKNGFRASSKMDSQVSIRSDGVIYIGVGMCSKFPSSVSHYEIYIDEEKRLVGIKFLSKGTENSGKINHNNKAGMYVCCSYIISEFDVADFKKTIRVEANKTKDMLVFSIDDLKKKAKEAAK